ncbi:MAG: hypothetical protein WD605_03115 [Candidatus Paceibacterota bacterium]
MSDLSRVNRLVVLLSAGLCLALPFIFTFLWWLVIPGLALAIHSIINCRNYIQAVSVGWFLGIAKSLGGFYFIWATFPLTGVASGNPILEWLSVGLFWVSTSVFMGIGGVVLGIGLHWLSEHKPILIPFIFPFLLILAEVVGSFFASIIFLGPGAFLNIYLAHGYVGILLSHLPILYPFVRLAGVYGLIFVAAVFGILFYRLFFEENLTRKTSVLALLSVSVIIYVLYLSYSPIPYVKNESRYLAIDTYFSMGVAAEEQNLLVDANKELLDAVVTAFKYNPDVILLPEDARLIDAVGSEQKTLAFLQSISSDTKPLVVDSARIEVNNNTHSYLRAFYYDTQGSQIYKKDKQYLIAEGEYISYLFSTVLSLLGQDQLLRSASEHMNYIPGPIKSYDSFPDDFPAVIFCFESSSALSAKLPDKNNRLGNVILHPVSHSNFHTPELFWYQLDALLRTQAIWSGKVIISATNMAQSKIYYPDGRIETGDILDKSSLWQLVGYEL